MTQSSQVSDELHQLWLTAGQHAMSEELFVKAVQLYTEQQKREAKRTREEAQLFAESIAKSDTGLGGWLVMSNSTNQFASLLFQFANPSDWLAELASQEEGE